MSTPLSALDVHRQYEEAVSAFLKTVPDATLRVKMGREVDHFFRSCALGVWQADGGAVTPGYVEDYNALYRRGEPAPTILFWELSTSVAGYSGFQSPDFFHRMRALDKVSRTQLSRRFVDLFTLMALLFAAVDGTVSEGEAAFVNRCADTLTRLCDKDGLEGGKAPLDAQDFVSRPAPRETGGKPQTPAPAGDRAHSGGAAGPAGRAVWAGEGEG